MNIWKLNDEKRNAMSEQDDLFPDLPKTQTNSESSLDPPIEPIRYEEMNPIQRQLFGGPRVHKVDISRALGRTKVGRDEGMRSFESAIDKFFDTNDSADSEMEDMY